MLISFYLGIFSSKDFIQILSRLTCCIHKIVVQNHRMAEVGRDHSGSSGPVSVLKQGHSRAHGLCPDCGVCCFALWANVTNVLKREPKRFHCLNMTISLCENQKSAISSCLLKFQNHLYSMLLMGILK